MLTACTRKTMLRLLLCIAALCLCTLALAAPQSAKAASKYHYTQKDWMKNLPDTMQISQINLPGTHDSGCFYIARGVQFTAQTQEWTIKQQLEHGIRFFDIRLGLRDKTNENKDPFYLRLCHGITDCYEDSHRYYQLLLTDVMKTVEDFLTKYPSETVVMIIREEKDDDPVDEKIQEIMARMHHQNGAGDSRYPHAVSYNAGELVPRLGEVRGKCVLLCKKTYNEEKQKYQNNLPYTDYETSYAWYGEENTDKHAEPKKKKERLENHLKMSEHWWQDYYSTIDRDRFVDTGATLEAMRRSGSTARVCAPMLVSTNITQINDDNPVTSVVFGYGPQSCWECLYLPYTHFWQSSHRAGFKEVSLNLANKRTGWWSFDFPQDHQINDIIESNFLDIATYTLRLDMTSVPDFPSVIGQLNPKITLGVGCQLEPLSDWVYNPQYKCYERYYGNYPADQSVKSLEIDGYYVEFVNHESTPGSDAENIIDTYRVYLSSDAVQVTINWDSVAPPSPWDLKDRFFTAKYELGAELPVEPDKVVFLDTRDGKTSMCLLIPARYQYGRLLSLVVNPDGAGKAYGYDSVRKSDNHWVFTMHVNGDTADYTGYIGFQDFGNSYKTRPKTMDLVVTATLENSTEVIYEKYQTVEVPQNGMISTDGRDIKWKFEKLPYNYEVSPGDVRPLTLTLTCRKVEGYNFISYPLSSSRANGSTMELMSFNRVSIQWEGENGDISKRPEKLVICGYLPNSKSDLEEHIVSADNNWQTMFFYDSNVASGWKFILWRVPEYYSYSIDSTDAPREYRYIFKKYGSGGSSSTDIIDITENKMNALNARISGTLDPVIEPEDRQYGAQIELIARELLDLSAEEERALKKVLDKGEEATVCLDISLFKTRLDDRMQMHELPGGALGVELELPEGLSKLSGMTFDVIRIHNGIAQRIGCAHDSVDHRLLFQSDRFSTYVITMRETAIPKLPQTGDDSNLPLILGMLLVSMSILAVLLSRRKTA